MSECKSECTNERIEDIAFAGIEQEFDRRRKQIIAYIFHAIEQGRGKRTKGVVVEICSNLSTIIPSRANRGSDQQIERFAKERRREIKDIFQIARGSWEKGVGKEEASIAEEFARIFVDEFDRFNNK